MQKSKLFADVIKKYEGTASGKSYEAYSTLRDKKLKMNKILIGKCKDMCESTDFEQDYFSKTAIGSYEIANDSIRILKWHSFL